MEESIRMPTNRYGSLNEEQLSWLLDQHFKAMLDINALEEPLNENPREYSRIHNLIENPIYQNNLGHWSVLSYPVGFEQINKNAPFITGKVHYFFDKIAGRQTIKDLPSPEKLMILCPATLGNIASGGNHWIGLVIELEGLVEENYQTLIEKIKQKDFTNDSLKGLYQSAKVSYFEPNQKHSTKDHFFRPQSDLSEEKKEVIKELLKPIIPEDRNITFSLPAIDAQKRGQCGDCVSQILVQYAVSETAHKLSKSAIDMRSHLKKPILPMEIDPFLKTIASSLEKLETKNHTGTLNGFTFNIRRIKSTYTTGYMKVVGFLVSLQNALVGLRKINQSSGLMKLKEFIQISLGFDYHEIRDLYAHGSEHALTNITHLSNQLIERFKLRQNGKPIEALENAISLNNIEIKEDVISLKNIIEIIKDEEDEDKSALNPNNENPQKPKAEDDWIAIENTDDEKDKPRKEDATFQLIGAFI